MAEYDATNRRHIRLAEKSAKLAETQRGDAIKGIMASAYGRQWMWDILQRCHVFSVSFTSASALATAFAEGERNIGLQFLNDIMAYCPDEYVAMAKESHERDITESVRRNTAESDAESKPSALSDDLYGDTEGDSDGDFFTERN